MPRADFTEGELRFVKQIIGEDPVWLSWVKKINIKGVIQDRLLALGIYRIYSIKRRKATGKKQVQRAGHILGLKEIYSDDIDRVKMDFGDFNIVVSGSNLGIELPRLLLNCFHQVTLSFPESACPKLVLLPQGRTPPILESVDVGIGGGLIDTYLAQCDYLNVAPSSDVITFLEDASNFENRHMPLDSIVGISKSSDFSFNISPLMAALRHNTYFTSFSCHEKSRKELVALLADVVLHNTTLTSVDLTGMEADDGWVQLGDALKANASSKIVDLLFSDNIMTDKGAAALAARLSNPHPHGLRVLQMDNTRVTGVGVAALMKGFSATRRFEHLEELSFSGNSLKNSAMAFSELVSSMATSPSCLREIKLANTQFDPAPLIDGLRNGLSGIIEHLDLTCCKMDEHAAKLCEYFFEKSTCAKQVSLMNCGLTGKQLTNIMNAISSNPYVIDLSLDISNNIIDSKQDCEIFCKAMADSKRIYSLALREIDFGKVSNEDSIAQVIKTLPVNSCFREIDLSGNFKLKPKEKDCGLGSLQLLASIVEKHPSITGLSVEGIGQNVAGRNISPIFQALSETSKLQKLSVKGHGFGDAGAKELFDILRWNTSLTKLNYDNNSLTSTGFTFALRCLNANRTLRELEYPKMDIAKAINKSSAFTTHESIFSIFSKISTFTSNNATGQQDERGAAPKKPTKELAYEVRKPSRNAATMVITRVTSMSALPIHEYKEEWSDDSSSDSSTSIVAPSSPRSPRPPVFPIKHSATHEIPTTSPPPVPQDLPPPPTEVLQLPSSLPPHLASPPPPIHLPFTPQELPPPPVDT